MAEYYKTLEELRAKGKKSGAIYRARAVKQRARKRKGLEVEVVRRSTPVELTRIVNENLDPNLLSSRQKRAIKRGRRRTRRSGVLKQKYSLKALHRAIQRVESEFDREELLIHFVRRAYVSDAVLAALGKKLLPDLKSVDAKIAQKSPFKLLLDVGPTLKQRELEGD